MNSEPMSDKERRKARAMTRDISKQVQFLEQWLTPDEWWVLVFGCLHGQHVVTNPFTGQGVVVVNNKRTKDLNVTTGAELITQLYAFGNERGVKWSDPKWKAEMAAAQAEAERWAA